jgi:DNA-binding IclR family transcriptional regulator
MHVIKSVQTALKILTCFTNDPPALGVTEIAKQLHLTKSTVSRILSTLEQARFVAKDPESQKYRLGAKVLEIAGVFLSGQEWRSAALPHMKALRDATGESVALFVVDQDRRICLEKFESAHELRSSIAIGGRYPLNAGAGGKLLLAHLPESERKEILGKTGLPRYTSHTIADPTDFERELQDIRRKGYATSNRERVPHLSSVSTPIRNFEGHVIAALCVDGPAVRFTMRKVKACVDLARRTAERISQEIGYRPPAAERGDRERTARPRKTGDAA